MESDFSHFTSIQLQLGLNSVNVNLVTVNFTKMPKEKRSLSVVLNTFVHEYEDFSTDGKVLFCKYCEVAVSAYKKFQVQQHIQTGKNIKNKNANISNQQRLLTASLSKPGPKHSEFNEDLCKAFISADIPLAKLRNKKLIEFLEKYTKRQVPDESTIRKNYVPELYKVTLNKLREKVGDNSIWVSLDETTDVDQRCVANFVLGILGVEEERSKSYLLTMKVLNKVNHSTVAAFFNDSLSLLWPSGIFYDRVLVVCTDAAPYMSKAMGGLKILYPKMIHVTCVAHGLHRVAELVRTIFPDVNMLISTVKKVFLKAPNRKERFREAAGTVPLPPSPVMTRWGTWIDAAAYYADNFELIKSVVDEFDPEEAQSIKDAQDVLKKNGIREDLVYIRANLTCISSAILKLEEKGLSLKSSIKLVEGVEDILNDIEKEDFSKKLSAVLLKNTGYLQLKKISNILQNTASINGTFEELKVLDIIKLESVPIVSCDVERVFSEYKTILADNRRKFVFEHLLHHVVIKCNHGL